MAIRGAKLPDGDVSLRVLEAYPRPVSLAFRFDKKKNLREARESGKFGNWIHPNIRRHSNNLYNPLQKGGRK